MRKDAVSGTRGCYVPAPQHAMFFDITRQNAAAMIAFVNSCQGVCVSPMRNLNRAVCAEISGLRQDAIHHRRCVSASCRHRHMIRTLIDTITFLTAWDEPSETQIQRPSVTSKNKSKANSSPTTSTNDTPQSETTSSTTRGFAYLLVIDG